jgi:UDP-N-acetylmuramate dehydrogenase
MNIEENKSLKTYNTFSIDCSAMYFVSIQSISDLKEVLQSKIHSKIFILGGGSNVLLTQDIDALVIHINLKGIEIISEDKGSISLKVMAGENWHDFVEYCIKHNYGGIENLSLIPGNVGTAPIQNIGAYGVELKDVFSSCSTISLNNLSEKQFNKEECKFGYRNSIFKNEEKGTFIITSVIFNLTKTNHNKSIGYGAIKEHLNNLQIENPTIKEISEAVIQIRKSKLPDPKELGNSGSFFKNPIINDIKFKKFHNNYPEAPYYKISNSEYKIPAGWLIEQSGFKGKRIGDAGVHKKQALVLVNYGNTTGKEIVSLSKKIQTKVKDDFGISIIPEVNII